MESPGWVISDNSNRQSMDHNFCFLVYLLLEALFHFRLFLLSCSSRTFDVPEHTKWKVDKCTYSKSVISGRDLKSLQMNWIGFCSFCCQERRKDFLHKNSSHKALQCRHHPLLVLCHIYLRALKLILLDNPWTPYLKNTKGQEEEKRICPIHGILWSNSGKIY